MFEDEHGPVATDRTHAQGDAREGFVSVTIIRWEGGRGSLRSRRAEEWPTAGERVFPLAVAEPAVVPNAREAGREHVQKQAAKELARSERHRFLVRDRVEEAPRGHGDDDRAGRQVFLAGQIHLVHANLLGASHGRRPAEMTGEPRDVLHVGALRRRRQIPNLHVFEHPLAKRDLSSSKRRPALVISPDSFNDQLQDLVLAAITSQVSEESAVAIDQDDCVDGALSKRS